MKVLRIYNRYAYAEILGGLIGGPLFVVVLYGMWFTDNLPYELGPVSRGVYLLGMLASPAFAVYYFYRALARTTKWVDFGKTIRVHRLLKKDVYAVGDLAEAKVENEPVGMDSGIPMVEINVAHERVLRLYDRGGGLIAELAIDSPTRMQVLEHLRQYPLGET